MQLYTCVYIAAYVCNIVWFAIVRIALCYLWTHLSNLISNNSFQLSIAAIYSLLLLCLSWILISLSWNFFIYLLWSIATSLDNFGCWYCLQCILLWSRAYWQLFVSASYSELLQNLKIQTLYLYLPSPSTLSSMGLKVNFYVE